MSDPSPTERPCAGPERGPGAAVAPGGFLAELLALWDEIPRKLVFGVLVVAWVTLFHHFGNATFGYIATPSLFVWLENAWRHGAEDQLGYLMPWVVLGLLWWKRAEWRGVAKSMAWGPLAWLAIAIAIHLVGYVVQQTRLSMVAFLLGLYGMVGIVWGGAMMRAVRFPLFLLIFCLPLGVTADNLTLPLRIFVAKTSTILVREVLGLDVVQVGSLIFNGRMTYQYDVAPACSGIRSLMALTALTTVYGFITFRSGWKRLLMMVIAVPLAVLGNVARIVSVVIFGEAFGQRAGATIEQPLGLVTYVVALGVVLLLGRWLREEGSPGALPAAEGRGA